MRSLGASSTQPIAVAFPSPSSPSTTSPPPTAPCLRERARLAAETTIVPTASTELLATGFSETRTIYRPPTDTGSLVARQRSVRLRPHA
ncbi:hypothetical protein BST61_g11536 [Cercospora zeina]